MKRVIVTLRVFSEELDPDNVTKILGTEPTSQYSRGDRISEYSAADKKHTNGQWSLERNGSHADFESILREFTKLVSEEKLKLLSELSTSQDILIGLFGVRNQSGFEIAPDILEQLGQRGWALIFDMYVEEEGDD